ncbi:hypothetical protein JWG45_04320 [Leptospira sp. 201903070]|uniref:DUF1564 family protein n=1 Tax=Leptospira ainlahdjerensis TaxID=2810033 RepID=A0ABS2U7N8_9LEPT|nr:hypothetical protein [Leptospira ainlahdjerensis]MBM9576374.1 hypothetical protein [Leptospira ainlahdjerensis]
MEVQSERSFAKGEVDFLGPDFHFLKSLKTFSLIQDSIFKIVFSDFSSNRFEFSDPNSPSFFVSFYFLDLLLPEKHRKIFPSFASYPTSFKDQRLIPKSISEIRLSFSHSVNRKLMRYYAIRSDGPPYHSLSQVSIV